MLFAESQTPSSGVGDHKPWRVLIVDDVAEVHTITKLSLSDVTFKGRRLELVSALSAAEAQTLLKKGPPFAVAFIDVVMERDGAGLELTKWIRDELRDHLLQIILRTGQPGMAPERDVLRDYEINDYLHKTQTTTDRLYGSTLTALRTHDALHELESLRRAEGRLRKGMEEVINGTNELYDQTSLSAFAQNLLSLLSSFLVTREADFDLGPTGLVAVVEQDEIKVIARAGRLVSDDGAPEAPPAELMPMFKACISSQCWLIEDESFVGYFASPHEEAAQLIYLEGSIDPNIVDARLLDRLARGLSLGFERHKRDEDAKKELADVIMVLGDAINRRSYEGMGHGQCVAEVAAMLARAQGRDASEVEALLVAAPLHDVGSVAIPDAVLHHPGKLSPEQRQLVERHTVIGERMFRNAKHPLLKAASIIAGQHHERFDGSGYPRRLKGKSIHIDARTVAIADAVDAMMQPRPYRARATMDDVVAEIRSQSGTQFDPELVELLAKHAHEARAIYERLMPEQASGDAAATGVRAHAMLTTHLDRDFESGGAAEALVAVGASEGGGSAPAT